MQLLPSADLILPDRSTSVTRACSCLLTRSFWIQAVSMSPKPEEVKLTISFASCDFCIAAVKSYEIKQVLSNSDISICSITNMDIVQRVWWWKDVNRNQTNNPGHYTTSNLMPAGYSVSSKWNSLVFLVCIGNQLIFPVNSEAEVLSPAFSLQPGRFLALRSFISANSHV